MVLIGAETNIDIFETTRIIQNKFNSTQITETFAPQTSYMQSLSWNPQLILGSPQASMAGITAIPTQAPSVTTIPTTTQESGYQEAPIDVTQGGGRGGIMDMLIVGAIAIVAIIFLVPFLKKKRKVKANVGPYSVDAKT